MKLYLGYAKGQLGPILFNTFFIDIACYADDRTPYITEKNDKCHLLVSKNGTVNLKIGNINITNFTCGNR